MLVFVLLSGQVTELEKQAVNILADILPRCDNEQEYILRWLQSPEAKGLPLRMRNMTLVELKVCTGLGLALSVQVGHSSVLMKKKTKIKEQMKNLRQVMNNKQIFAAMQMHILLKWGLPLFQSPFPKGAISKDRLSYKRSKMKLKTNISRTSLHPLYINTLPLSYLF